MPVEGVIVHRGDTPVDKAADLVGQSDVVPLFQILFQCKFHKSLIVNLGLLLALFLGVATNLCESLSHE